MKTQQTHLGSEVLTAVVMKSSIFWDTTSCRIWGSHSGGYEEFSLLGYNVLHAAFLMLVSCMSSSKTLKMEATYPPKTSVELQWATRRDISEDSILPNMRPTIRSTEVHKPCVRSRRANKYRHINWECHSSQLFFQQTDWEQNIFQIQNSL
jgi:hypothetical protein